SWKDYKNQLKHKQKQLPLADLITHIIIEDTNRKESKAAKAKALAAKANLVQNKTRHKSQKSRPGHHAPQCRYRKGNDNPPKPRANLAEGDDKNYDVIVAVISQANIVTDVSKWVIDSGATRLICANKDAFTSYTAMGDGEEQVYLGDSRTVAVHGKGKVMLKLTSGKTLTLTEVLHVPEIRTNIRTY
ncbi:gag-pol polyprotein, partial [Trifolium pratense]